MKRNKGLILVNVLVFAAVAIIITSALVEWGAIILKNEIQLTNSQEAFEIAESGIDYYKWHLNNLPTDYYDGNASTTSPGPYVHSFQDKDGNIIGQFSLKITPPATGTTIVTVKSTGTSSSTPVVSRSIQAQFAIPSFAQYAVVANDNMNFGAGTVTYGPIQSNYGIHFDGVAHNIVGSSLSTYVDPDAYAACILVNNSSYCTTTSTEYAVYTTGDPQPPTTQPSDSTIFLAGRSFPVPSVDFPGLVSNLNTLQSLARSGGKELTSSNADGWHIVFQVVNGVTTYNLYKVTSLVSTPSACGTDQTALSQTNGPQYQWGTWSIQSQTPYNTNGSNNYTLPTNGIIFVDDNVWVDGQIDNARVTIGSGIVGDSNPKTYSNITVNNNLQYTNFNGGDVVGLIAQGNINVGMVSSSTLTIDAALVAQNGRIGRYYYYPYTYSRFGSTGCGIGTTDYSTLLTLNMLGMIATNQRYGFAYSDGTGYTNRNITYDSNLLYGPPPSFPLASSQYSTISWKEVPN